MAESHPIPTFFLTYLNKRIRKPGAKTLPPPHFFRKKKEPGGQLVRAQVSGMRRRMINLNSI